MQLPLYYLAPGASGQSRENAIGIIGQEMHRAIGEEKMRSPGVEGPEVKQVALISGSTGDEIVGSDRAAFGISFTQVNFPYSQ
jgi:hypothetical protein